MVIYRDWIENGVLNIDYTPFDCFEWITPELMEAVKAGDVNRAKELAGIE